MRRRQIAAAFHEAGHAVAAYHTGVRFRRVLIGKNTGKELGCLELWLTPQSTADGAVLDFFEAVRYASAYLRWMQLRVRALRDATIFRRPQPNSWQLGLL